VSTVRAVSGGLVSVITALAMVVTLLLALAIGLDLPQAVAHGLPDARSAQDIQNVVFPHSPMWPLLMLKLLYCAAGVFGIIASGMMMAARRRTTFPHLLRGLAGLAGLIAAVVVLTIPFRASESWEQVSNLVASHKTDQAIDFFFSQFRDGQPLKAAAICVASFLMLSIPYHRRMRNEKGLA
jgi:hypothetical protein